MRLNIEPYSSHHEAEYKTFNKFLYLSIAETFICVVKVVYRL